MQRHRLKPARERFKMHDDYDVIYGNDLEGVTKLVKAKIAEGWQCQGGISATTAFNGAIVFFAQAIVKLADGLEYA